MLHKRRGAAQTSRSLASCRSLADHCAVSWHTKLAGRTPLALCVLWMAKRSLVSASCWPGQAIWQCSAVSCGAPAWSLRRREKRSGCCVLSCLSCAWRCVGVVLGSAGGVLVTLGMGQRQCDDRSSRWSVFDMSTDTAGTARNAALQVHCCTGL